MIVLDTSALLFLTLNPDYLSPLALSTLNKANVMVISAMSIWEIGLKSKKGHLDIGGSLHNYVQVLQKIDNLIIKPVDTETWIENVLLPWSHKDPADRTIVATAQLLNCPLVTSDKEIRKFYPQAIW